MNRDKTRSGMLGAAEVYLLYLAYSLLEGAGSADGGISPFVRVLFIVLFGLGGAALLVYAAQASDVVMTMVDGRILYENGEYLTLDRERVLYDARKAVERLYGGH